jgi:hypothetical protein
MTTTIHRMELVKDENNIETWQCLQCAYRFEIHSWKPLNRKILVEGDQWNSNVYHTGGKSPFNELNIEPEAIVEKKNSLADNLFGFLRKK